MSPAFVCLTAPYAVFARYRRYTETFFATKSVNTSFSILVAASLSPTNLICVTCHSCWLTILFQARHNFLLWFKLRRLFCHCGSGTLATWKMFSTFSTCCSFQGTFKYWWQYVQLSCSWTSQQRSMPLIIALWIRFSLAREGERVNALLCFLKRESKYFRSITKFTDFHVTFAYIVIPIIYEFDGYQQIIRLRNVWRYVNRKLNRRDILLAKEYWR